MQSKRCEYGFSDTFKLNAKLSVLFRSLIVGDVKGKFKSVFARIDNVNKKSGPFDLVLCVGNFFGSSADLTELNEYKSKRKTSKWKLGRFCDSLTFHGIPFPRVHRSQNTFQCFSI